MKAILIALLLVALAHTQHVDEDKQTLILAGQIQDLQTANVETVTVPDSDKKNGTKVKLKEFEDHAELKVLTEKPEESSTLTTPVPKPVSTENVTETNEDQAQTTTTQSASKQLDPVGVTEALESGVYDSKPSVPKKGADPKDEKLSVPKKGADPKDEKQSVPKKGADPKDEKQSVPKKGADPKDEKPSVPKKGVDPKDNVESLLGKGVMRNGDVHVTSTVPKKGVDPDDERKSVPRKGADPSVLGEPSSTVGYLGTDAPRLISPGKTGETYNKNRTGPNMPTPSTKKKFMPTLNEASMDFGESSTKPYVTIPTSVTPVTPSGSDVSSSRPEELEPPAEDTTTTEGYSTTNFKPTAATDTKGKGGSEDEENISYTPAVVGVVLLVVIFITVIVVGYRRLQDVWMRRHYARMDFLIDGMYDV
ncbi:trans-Golgi network integral membrane protein 2-like [Macrobrachium rosenbergii]|uniref:trans-Golgi network integral membrane protein 2-like n=1 Tax=Macrobrachium rosenbergii TaxID=79674 RepID=UPI0034D4D48B